MSRKKLGKGARYCKYCGSWAEFACQMCGHGLCLKHARYWATAEAPPKTMPNAMPAPEAAGYVVTCGEKKCQAKIPKDVRKTTIDHYVDTLRDTFKDAT